ncbi:MAG: acyl carrier protein [bacterium]
MSENLSIEDRIKEIIATKIMNKRKSIEISNDQPLSTNGVGLDSLDFLKLLTSIEKEFSIQIEDDYWSQEVLNNISKIANYIRKRLGSLSINKEIRID